MMNRHTGAVCLIFFRKLLDKKWGCGYNEENSISKTVEKE